MHPMHGFIAVIPLLLVFLSFSLMTALLALAGAEAVVIAVFPHLPVVRKSIDARLLEKRRVEAAAERAALLTQMSDGHRRTFADLERIASCLRARVDWPDPGEDDLGLKRLLSLYVRLAIAHGTAANALQGCAPCGAEEDDIARLQAASPAGRDGSDPDADALRQSAARRIAILRMRGEARRSAREALSAMDLDLATIADTLRWMHERCATAGAGKLRKELSAAWLETKRDGEMLRELCFLSDRESLTPGLFDLGDDGPSQPGAAAVRVGGSLRVADAAAPCGMDGRPRPDPARIGCDDADVEEARDSARGIAPDLLRVMAAAGPRSG
ncbi:MAG: hypothetical protein JOZ69_01565 [Myxococcales bacterium]|nr:hypothetical protein [Myxococcales bacterium]